LITTVIFDFDGLILDTEMPEFQSWQEVYRDLGCELPVEKWCLCIGGTEEHFDVYSYLEEQLGRPVDRAALRAKRYPRHLQILEQQVVLPGVEQYLNEARRLGLKIGLASNSSRTWVFGHLRRLGLDSYFDHSICGDEVSNRKPEPELYLTALAGLNAQPEQAIAFEDSPHGVRAAQRAGIFAVTIPNMLTSLLSLDHADLRLTSMAEMPLSKLIASVERRRTAICE
jgi:HAD superfamily hydrolase (TIGR01509 family)